MTPTTIVCGPPGAGKSTYVSARKRDNDLIVDVDALFKALTGLDGREKPEVVLPFVLEAIDAVLGLLKRGFLGPTHAWIITGGENNESREMLARSLNAKVVVLPTPTGECVARMRAQGRPEWHIREVTEVCLRWHVRFQMNATENLAEGYERAIGSDGYPL
jgi:predicted kinase